MAQREIFHVLQSEGRWQVRREGANGAVSRHGSKEQAVRAGCDKARRSALATVVVHRRDGAIESEVEYGSERDSGSGGS